jgi:hypothetical protein
MLGVLRALLAGLVDIVLLRRGPDVLPTSTALLAIVVVMHTALYALLISKFSPLPPAWPVALVLSVAFTLGWYFVTLRRANKPERFTQTTTAMYGANLLFLPVVIPLAFVSLGQPKEQQATSSVLVLVIVGVTLWALSVNVHIVRSALEWPILGALGLIIAQNVAWFVVSAVLFGGPAPP